jgi:hypothetical protein
MILDDRSVSNGTASPTPPRSICEATRHRPHRYVDFRRLAKKMLPVLMIAAAAYSLSPRTLYAATSATVTVHNSQERDVFVEWSLTGQPGSWHSLGVVEAHSSPQVFDVVVSEQTQVLYFRADRSNDTIQTSTKMIDMFSYHP